MPKMKTNRTAYKRIKIGGNGRARRAKACMSHNTAKKSQKRVRRLQNVETVDTANEAQVARLLPYHKRH
jgi:large subunit ribosomal protein L35